MQKFNITDLVVVIDLQQLFTVKEILPDNKYVVSNFDGSEMLTCGEHELAEGSKDMWDALVSDIMGEISQKTAEAYHSIAFQSAPKQPNAMSIAKHIQLKQVYVDVDAQYQKWLDVQLQSGKVETEPFQPNLLYETN